MKKNNEKYLDNKLSGRYEIIEQVGVGGMSYVYKANDTKKKKIVAIKMLKDELSSDADFLNKFKAEAIACKDIRHENVISAIDVVDEGNMHYIVMEFVEGTTLNKYIKKKGMLTNEETVDIALQVASGLKAAHKQGIVHRDIKPQNIVINSKGVAKITDFGIARAVSSTTRTISVVGTVHYISPEQIRNKDIDFRSDIYSFGCTMYEMITGKVPFEGETTIEIIIAHIRDNLKSPHIINEKIYKSIEKIILKCTRTSKNERYENIDDVIKDLKRALLDKDGEYIKDNLDDEDDEGKTVIIDPNDMKIIKAISKRYTDESSYKNDDNLTDEQKQFIDKYIKNGKYNLQHQLFKKIVIAASIFTGLLILVVLLLKLDTRKEQHPVVQIKEVISTISVVKNDLKKSLVNADFEFAKNLANEYGITLNVVGYEYSDNYDVNITKGKILQVVVDNMEKDSTLDIILSKGQFNMDFTNVEELNNTKWTDMMQELNDRNLKYSVVEINDINVPRGFIIGANKKNSSELGDLIFTVSRGISDQIKTMPDLYNKSIEEVKTILAKYELALGDISFRRDYNIPENYVIKQSVNAGEEVKSGTMINLTLSCGVAGVEYLAEPKPKWHSELSATYRINKGDLPTVQNTDETVIIQVRLMQQTAEGVVYTELMEPQEYKIGTIIPLIFTNIEGEEKNQYGEVQVVDVVNDYVLSSIKVMFWP